MVDHAKLRALLDRLRGFEAELRRLRDAGWAAVRNDVDRLNSVKYLFVLAAEIAVDDFARFRTELARRLAP